MLKKLTALVMVLTSMLMLTACQAEITNYKEVSIRQIIAEYESNPTSAKEKYENQYLLV